MLLRNHLDITVVGDYFLSVTAHDVVDEILCSLADLALCCNIERSCDLVGTALDVLYGSLCPVDFYCLYRVI